MLLAKNLDWPISDGIIFVNERGEERQSLCASRGEKLTWTATYGSVTLNQFGRGFPLGGMNEAGLVVEELSYSPSQYPAPDERAALPDMQWIQYQLDNHSTVQHVIESDAFLRPTRLIAHLHFMVADRSGAVAVIEFLEGRMVYYTGEQLPAPALSNNSYENLIKYLGRHAGFGGERLVSDGPESQERFVRAATMLKNKPPLDNAANIDYAFKILNNVAQHDTQWRIVYDVQRLQIYFRYQAEEQRAQLNFKTMNFDQSLHLPIQAYAGDVTKAFETYEPQTNIELLENVFQQLVDLDELDNKTAQHLILRLSNH